jgi:osmotically-inducible protein OsmY
MRRLLYAAVVVAAPFAGCEDRTSAPAPNNTAQNGRDRSGGTVTPMDQSNAAKDLEITAAIRRAITDDASMSADARNCKIVTAAGVVTLRGVVASAAEKDAIETRARAVAGVVRVDNQLEVKAP